MSTGEIILGIVSAFLFCTTIIVLAMLKQARDTAVRVSNVAGTAWEEVTKPVGKVLVDVGSAIADRLRKREQLNRLNEEIISLHERIAHLEAHKITAKSMQPIAQLALIDVPFEHVSYERYRLSKEDSGWFSRKTEVEYLGVFAAKYTKKFGVDLKKLRFEIISPEQIAVGGLNSPELIGVRGIDIKPLLTEIREHLSEGSLRDNVSTILKEDSGGKRSEATCKQQQGILEKINSDDGIESVNRAIQQLALRFLQVCFNSSGFSIVQREDLSSTKGFVEICNGVNGYHDQELGKTRARLAETKAMAKQIEANLFGNQTDKSV